MRRYLMFLLLMMLGISAFAQTDEEFKQIMEQYKVRLSKVKTRQEGAAILAEMQAKQQAYLKQKLAPVNAIKAQLGTDQAKDAMSGMKDKQGLAKYENNPMYTKCRVEMHYNFTQDDVANGDRGPTTFKSNGSCSVIATSFLFKYAGKIVLSATGDAIVNGSVSGSVSANSSDPTGNGTHTYSDQGSALNTPSPVVNLNYESPTNWSASAKVLLRNNHNDNATGSVTDTTDAYAAATNTDGTLTMNGEVISIAKNFNDHTTTGDGKHKQSHNFTGSLTIKITPITDNYLVWFEPVAGQSAYERWMPEGYGSKADKHGNFIDIKLKVEDKKQPGKDASNQIKYIVWELPKEEISKLPGYACNAPNEWTNKINTPADHINRLADMQLRRLNEQPDTAAETLADTTTVANNNTIRVYSFDWGGYARLTAHVYFTDGSDTYAVEKGNQNNYLLLPKRDGDSKVATYFKQINKVLDKKDTDDDEKILHDDKFPGDGFTLYEEYRGFMEHGKHIYGDPNAKDVMIYNGINTDRSRDGIMTYEMVLNNYTKQVVKTHHRFTKDEFGLIPLTPPSTEIAASRKYEVEIIHRDKCLNFNNIRELHSVDQHGICMLQTQKRLGFAFASSKTDVLGTPNDFDFLVISADFRPDAGGWTATKVDLNDDGTFTVNPNGKSVVTTDQYAMVIAHEMLHNSGVEHHGNNDAYGSDRAEFNYNGNGYWQINKGNKVKLQWENKPGVDIEFDDPKFAQILKLFNDSLAIRTYHGTCSGFEDCIMRYDDARAYCKDANSSVIYIIDTDPNKYAGELNGMHLCTDKKGTGVNDPEHRPRIRYGDADNGDCIHQFKINDKYSH